MIFTYQNITQLDHKYVVCRYDLHGYKLFFKYRTKIAWDFYENVYDRCIEECMVFHSFDSAERVKAKNCDIQTVPITEMLRLHKKNALGLIWNLDVGPINITDCKIWKRYKLQVN